MSLMAYGGIKWQRLPRALRSRYGRNDFGLEDLEVRHAGVPALLTISTT